MTAQPWRMICPAECVCLAQTTRTLRGPHASRSRGVTRSSAGALEREAAHEADTHVACDAVTIDRAGERESQWHRAGDVDLPGDVVAVHRAIEDRGRISFRGLTARQCAAGAGQAERCITIPHRGVHGDFPVSVDGHVSLSPMLRPTVAFVPRSSVRARCGSPA